jgi:hypothetical protein
VHFAGTGGDAWEAKSDEMKDGEGERRRGVELGNFLDQFLQELSLVV